MAVRSPKNEFRGINPHLNSFLQDESGGWESFHTDHITHLRSALQRQLPENYYVLSEKSLQLREYTPSGENEITKTIPDLSIISTHPGEKLQSSSLAATPSIVLSITDTFPEQEHLTSAVIHEIVGGQDKPVTRIELLSPSNKPPNSHYQQYMDKRQETLESGISVVELDYLHKTRSIFKFLPNYPKKESGAYPFAIFVSDPHPSLAQGMTQIFRFGVDEPIPVVNIPLAREDVLTFDFGAVYDYTFGDNRYYYTVIVDYSVEPMSIYTYQEADQRRIRARMATILSSLSNPGEKE